MRATVIADASFCQATRAAGYAAWVRVDGVGAIIKRMGGIGKAKVTNSTDAEVWAVIYGAEAAIENGATCVLIQSDCMAVCTLSHAAWRSFVARHPGVQFDARHVKGHTAGLDARTWVNNWCDTYAKREMRKKRRQM